MAETVEELRARLQARVGKPPPRPDIWFRARGKQVEYLQRRLEAHGVYSVSRGDDYGLFGAGTEQAVRAFQSMCELRCDGICGSVTWAALDTEPRS